MDELINPNDIDISPDLIEVKTTEETIVKDEDMTATKQSPNFKSGSKGWRLNSNGIIEAREANFSDASGTFYASSDGVNFNLTITYVNGIITSVI